MAASMITAATRALLELGDRPGIGTAGLRRAIEQKMLVSDSYHRPHEPKAIRGSLTAGDAGLKRKMTAYDTVARCEDNGIGIISPLDDPYPLPLRWIKEYPPILYTLGNQEILRGVAVSVVGTREASHLGRSWARQIGELLALSHITVVSGLALGIDTEAHIGALKGNGGTVAVLAHGLDKITPTSNRPLADEILTNGGLLLSEHAPGVPPRRVEYVRRNRLQSGMSVCSIIVESGREGGAIHQARFTRSQGRDLFTVVPPKETTGVASFNHGGSEYLTQEMSARAISSREDVLRLVHSGYFESRFKMHQHHTDRLL
jgi:DNA processing protein